ncbi:MAG: PD-(D/E)XK nuclease family protein [archaeon]
MKQLFNMLDNYKKQDYARIQSSSSILTYKQCPRKYYNEYILGIKPEPNIYLIRGKIVHTVLEHFYDIELDEGSAAYLYEIFWQRLMFLFNKEWSDKKDEFTKLDLEKKELEFYKQESREMLHIWLMRFLGKISMRVNKGEDTETAFKNLIPEREVHIVSELFGVQGYIDSLLYGEIIDYKTSNKCDLTPEYKIQLGIYCLLHLIKYNRMPKKAGIDFLKFKEMCIEDEDELNNLAYQALFEIEQVHMSTTTNEIEDYPCKESPLCKWENERGTGECHHYKKCRNKSLLKN